MQKYIKPKPIQFTPEGLENVKKEYNELQLKRKDAVKELEIYRAMGDRSENAAYKTARQKLSSIDYRLRYLTMLQRNGQMISIPTDGSIGIGSTVTINDGSQNMVYIIVGEHESDLSAGKISSLSPMGKALMGKQINDTAIVPTPSGKKSFHIVNIK